jgi:hypothetical protein
MPAPPGQVKPQASLREPPMQPVRPILRAPVTPWLSLPERERQTA